MCTELPQARGGEAFFVDFSKVDAVCDAYARANPLDTTQTLDANLSPVAPSSLAGTAKFSDSLDSPAADSPDQLRRVAGEASAFFVSLDAAACSSPIGSRVESIGGAAAADAVSEKQSKGSALFCGLSGCSRTAFRFS